LAIAPAPFIPLATQKLGFDGFSASAPLIPDSLASADLLAKTLRACNRYQSSEP
jgi:hypothetical protein